MKEMDRSKTSVDSSGRLDHEGYMIPLPSIPPGEKESSVDQPEYTTLYDDPRPSPESAKNTAPAGWRRTKKILLIIITVLCLIIAFLVAVIIWKVTTCTRSSSSSGQIGDGSRDPGVHIQGGSVCGLECSGRSPCKLPDVNTNTNNTGCIGCKQAVVAVDYYTFCTSSCDVYMTDVTDNVDGTDICQAQTTRNVALSELNATCEESSKLYKSDDNDCYRALEADREWVTDHVGPGEWMSVTFPQPHLVTAVEIRTRTYKEHHCSSLELHFSDNYKIKIEQDCPQIHVAGFNQYYFPPIDTTYIRVKCLVICNPTGRFGLRRLGVLALD